MKIIKVLGNNAVSAVNEKGQDVILTGKGVGFGVSSGDEVDEKKVTRVFLPSSEKQYYFQELVRDMPEEHIQCASEIISYAEVSLGKKLSDYIYITLTDHLNFAIERQKNGIVFENAMQWEIKKFYHHEFAIGKEALEMVKDKLGIELPESEAGFFALHIINAELGTDMEQSIAITQTIQDILNIVKYHFNIFLDEDTLQYERFLTHLKFFLQRTIKGQCYKTEDKEFCELVFRKYADAYECVQKIEEYMLKKMKHEMTKEEEMYLTVHIKRVIS